MTVPPPAGGSGRVVITCPTGCGKRFSGHDRRHCQLGNLMNWKAGASYHLMKCNVYILTTPTSPAASGPNNFALAQSGSGNSANRTDFKPQANTSEIGTKWQVLDKRLLLTAALFRTDIKIKLSKMMTGLIRNTVRKTCRKAMISVAGHHSRVAGDWLYPAKSNHQNGKDVAQDGSPYRCRIPRSTPSPYGANIRQPTHLLARAHAISAVCIKVQTARWERQRLPKVTGSPMPNSGIELIAISTSS